MQFIKFDIIYIILNKNNTILMKNNQIRSWYFYDFASSAFSTTVITVFLGPYLTTIASNAAINGKLNLFGILINPASLFAYGISISVLLQVFILPYFSGLVDLTGKKKEGLSIFSTIGAISTMLMYFLSDEMYLYGFILLIISNLSFGTSMVIYNSILNDICRENERDKVSSVGYAYGYIGGGVLLLLNLILYNFASQEGFLITVGEAVRISLLSAGMWWFIFSLYPIIILKNIKTNESLTSSKLKPLRSFFNTFSNLKNHPNTLIFLIAYLLYNDGVQAVITFASQFGIHELKLEESTLITVILLVQFVAFFGALFFNYISIKIGTKETIMITLIIWILGLLYAYFILKDASGFMILGLTVGFIMGGTQALSRSIYSRLIPKGEEAEYFSIYEISERGTSWLGSLVFGLTLEFSNSYRYAILSLLVFFILGGIILVFFKNRTQLNS